MPPIDISKVEWIGPVGEKKYLSHNRPSRFVVPFYLNGVKYTSTFGTESEADVFHRKFIKETMRHNENFMEVV